MPQHLFRFELERLTQGVPSGRSYEIGPISNDSKSPKWVFNKMLAHPTKDRDPRGFNYGPFLDLVTPKIKLLVEEIRRLEKAQGRDDFPSLG